MALTTNEITNSAEYTVEKKVEGAYLWKRIGLWAAYIGGPLVLLVVAGLTSMMAIWLIVFVPIYFPFLLPKIIYPATYCYAQIEYEYSIMAGKLLVNYVYGRKKRVEFMPPQLVSDMELIAPYKDEYRKQADEGQFAHKYEAFAYREHPDNYVCIFTNEKGEKCCVIFQCTQKFLKLFTFHNKNTIEGQLTA